MMGIEMAARMNIKIEVTVAEMHRNAFETPCGNGLIFGIEGRSMVAKANWSQSHWSQRHIPLRLRLHQNDATPCGSSSATLRKI
jgi:hypothetical protein